MNQSNHNHDVASGDVQSLEQQLKELQPRPVRFDAETILDAVASSDDSAVRLLTAQRRNRFSLATASICGFAAGVLVTFVMLSHDDSSGATNQELAMPPQEHLAHQDPSTKPLPSATSLDLAILVPLTAGNMGSRLSLPENEPVVPFQSSDHKNGLIDGVALTGDATPNVEQLIKELLGARR